MLRKKLLVGALAALGLLGLALAQEGARLYGQYCQSCHQPTGFGVPGAFPSLKGLDQLAKEEKGRVYLIRVVLFGLQGPLKVGSATYNGVMPGYGRLSDAEVAALLNYVLSSFGNKNPRPISPEEVKKLRASPLKPQDVAKTRP
ncbi:c-type cytochrome [Thermus scotoductus]|uniref:Cytochrome C biogenesis protein CcsB n=1 Tax=Thermus scotoductus TaxID=37636 RepID=A0A430REL0_THESC|nr:cytochrome c [Thermus scotoductus]RTG97445.1 cytochrome C biogenesis protein CcsB [Thermus scotoductus]RTH05897.1 cytochrome C biogenesis protein CcsB [Thermus scotoductus]RTH22406.1 cytochrome C biogenesis protein CcsB [Thermus scotoductus]RTI01920.1 cytochrome C biogenesis protein CcsB [Thermus scotoductus]RTI24262.1 cytochrome C biogenesis protein CcsB [Thermus scotoductus]